MKLCKCGCGEEIIFKRHHKYINVEFIVGHNNKGKVVSETTKEKISIAHIGIKPNYLARQKMSDSALKNWESAEYKKLHSGVNAPMYNKKQSEASKEKLRISMEPILKSPEYIEKQRIAKTKFWQDPTNKARVIKSNLLAWDGEERRAKCSERFLALWQNPEHAKRMSERNKGDKSPCWRGGRKTYGKDWTEDLKDAIRKRDSYECQVCGISQEDAINKHLDVHHVNYIRGDCDPKNLISLCRSCHTKTGYKRDSWIAFFSNFVKERMAINA